MKGMLLGLRVSLAGPTSAILDLSPLIVSTTSANKEEPTKSSNVFLEHEEITREFVVGNY